jgi:hyaluronoglucosaminidase
MITDTAGQPFPLGIIEGFFGRPWSWETRYQYARFLKENDYRYYIYAPKLDPYLRRDWQQPWPPAEYAALKQLGAIYHQVGLEWGIGFTPFELHYQYTDEQNVKILEQKVHYLNTLQPDILAILFDDMRGSQGVDHQSSQQPIAQIQADITHRIIDISTAKWFIMCPTYYSSTPVLDRLFGDRPPYYLETLGQKLDPAIRVFWTGTDICSTAYSQEHLQEIADQLGRKPFIWDNYPVNDSAKMCRFLHLGAFENRPHQMTDWTAGHAVNPMNQANLSQIPLKTLTLSYRQQDLYTPQVAFADALRSLCSEPLATLIEEELPLFQDKGLDGLSVEDRERLIKRYSLFPNAVTQEIVDWLNGQYPYSMECLTE